MSDFEPGFANKDWGEQEIDSEVYPFLTTEEREAVETAGLFAGSDEDHEKYVFACVVQGLNPDTQEPWTDQEAEDFAQERGHDPRDIHAWMEDAERMRKMYEQYLHEIRRNRRNDDEL